ncbi:ribonuclease P [Streptococcus sp. X16XC17]|uniref:hypothetical protein n=1 Tax=unclassified Streptococcus TaxID=2608887 RepID=UPI00066FBCC9|nr:MULTISPECIES: hypothetical protein [unclassified Streptococcus]TCD45810.1 ribonuclease P [Streptococcus sp. X16XC17]
MTKYSAISAFLVHKGAKYIMPEKASDLRQEMERIKREGQAARLAFSQLATRFQTLHPQFRLQRVSNWVNQAQIARPHFWVYLLGHGEITEPVFALRLYGEAEHFGISVEVSIMERKKDQYSLEKQARLLNCPAQEGTYYQYMNQEEVIRIPATEENRLNLRDKVQSGAIRKVLAKTDIDWTEGLEETVLLQGLYEGMMRLVPYYEETRNF